MRQDADRAVTVKRRQKRGLGALGSWAAGGTIDDKSPEEQAEDAKTDTFNSHRNGVVWFLQQQLQQCHREQSEMMEIRIQRQIEKSKNVLNPDMSGSSLPPSIWEDPTISAGGAGTMNSKKAKSFNRAPVYDLSTFDDSQQDSSIPDDQLQMLEEENKSMLRIYEDKLDQVR